VAIYKSKVKHACRVADRIVAISEQTRNDIIEFLNVDPDKISVVYQGCHENFSRSCTVDEISSIRSKYGLPSRYVLNVGTIESRKNVLLAVEALKNVAPEVHLVVVGRATGYFDKVKKYIRDNALESRVHFVHKAAFADLPAIYAGAEIFVYPSLFEGFGIPLVEAIKQGVPIITSTGSCFREAAGPDAVYVDPGNSKEMSENINRIISDELLRQSMIAKSREYVRRFEPSIIASDLMKVYQG
jgi:glycosyltransferase involved in cell wall biosynthesis